MDNIPNFVLYGEQGEEIFPDYLHIESIRARSLRHGWKFRPHRHHNLHQFFFIAKGGGRALIEELNHPLLNGLVIVMPPMAVHGFEFLPDTEGWVLTIPTPFLQRILEEEPQVLEYLSNIRIFQGDEETAGQFRGLFAAIETEHAASKAARGLFVRSMVTLLACSIFRACPPEEETRQEAANQKQVILRNFQTLVDEQFKARWPVARYADRLGITPTHLSRICRQVLHVPASELVTERSLLEARRLLIYTSLTIAEIAYDLGFSDPAHFSKFFREKTGKKPSEFRQTFTKRA
ncbi:helix-turn-helix domain-containing protein [Emcibacter sp.]|uniref:helix-turn-helix domain-containing protein n=1 Tax=Emcibacter sp. TaxID=1979954 RepID=UPI002AA76C57|nr:helix-turn-helix domain-containing protein [Emcibacter sp.]